MPLVYSYASGIEALDCSLHRYRTVPEKRSDPSSLHDLRHCDATGPRDRCERSGHAGSTPGHSASDQCRQRGCGGIGTAGIWSGGRASPRSRAAGSGPRIRPGRGGCLASAAARLAGLLNARAVPSGARGSTRQVRTFPVAGQRLVLWRRSLAAPAPWPKAGMGHVEPRTPVWGGRPRSRRSRREPLLGAHDVRVSLAAGSPSDSTSINAAAGGPSGSPALCSRLGQSTPRAFLSADFMAASSGDWPVHISKAITPW